jgi:hypothetical protein
MVGSVVDLGQKLHNSFALIICFTLYISLLSLSVAFLSHNAFAFRGNLLKYDTSVAFWNFAAVANYGGTNYLLLLFFFYCLRSMFKPTCHLFRLPVFSFLY